MINFSAVIILKSIKLFFNIAHKNFSRRTYFFVFKFEEQQKKS